MIFVGDISLPLSNSISIKKIPSELLKKKWIGNLEGGLIDNSNEEFKKSRAVFNDKKAIEQLVNEFNFIGFLMANNHILDLTSTESNFNFLKKLNVPYTGLGENLFDASKPLILEDEKVIILNFGWEVIQCEIASKNIPGVNPLQKKHVLTVLSDTIAQYPNSKVIPYMHWSYELEAEPQPFERELARNMIDIGAAGVIGSHPHRIGGFERYKDKPIVYSLGNWMFMQHYYFDEKLSFPDFCNLELAFEWDLKVNSFKFHFFDYNRKENTLTYLKTEDEKGPTLLNQTPFFNYSAKEYNKWYKRNHYHKYKGLPIYYWEDSPFQIKCKNKWVSLRAKLMKIIFNKGK